MTVVWVLLALVILGMAFIRLAPSDPARWHVAPKGDKDEILANMHDVLEAADAAVRAGKIRHFALSNESAWGTAQWLRLAEMHGLPRVQTVQNEYSLMCRLYDTDMAEMAVNEDITLLSFSPLACGMLTGKYQGGAVPEGSRMSLGPEMGGRMTDRTLPIVQVYLDIAKKHGIDPVHMAMAWQRTRPFPISAIFGTTSSDQLAHLIAGDDLVLGQEVVDDINAAHRANPMPY